MNKTSDIIYTYSKYYVEPLKTCILLAENWFSSDADVKYFKYLEQYLKNRNAFKNDTIEEIVKVCQNLADTENKECHSIITGSFMEYLTANQRLSDEQKYKLRSEIDIMTPFENLDDSLLSSLRKLEEETIK